MTALDWWRHTAILTATVGQLCFVGLWLSRRWWMHWVTRAIMAKSFTLLLLLLLASAHLLVQYAADVPPWMRPPRYQPDGWDTAEVGLYWLVAVGIWAQFVALVVQIRIDGHKEGHTLTDAVGSHSNS